MPAPAHHQVKLAISHALAQCSKLGIYETRVMTLVNEVRAKEGGA